MSSRLIGPGSGANIRPMQWDRPPGLSIQAETRQLETGPIHDDTPSTAAMHREWERKAQEAYQQGLREGEHGAARKWNEELGRKIEQLARGAEALAAYRDRIRREAEIDLVKLSLTISRRLLRRE